MAIPEAQLEKAREMIERAARPLFLHDDDCDGVASFVLCCQLSKDGRGVCVKQSPTLSAAYLRKVEETAPDLVVILDKPDVEEEFFRGVSVPVLWIDHHQPRAELVARFPNVTYLNPRLWDDKDNRPTSYWAYRITRLNLWMAVVGSVADWHLPDYLDEFKERYPDLLPKEYSRVEDLYLDTPLGEIIKAIQFNLKGTTTDVRKSILTLTRVESPYEILMQSTPRGRFIWKKYRKLAAGYDRHMEQARLAAEKPGKMLLYAYEDAEQTYTSELSNELLIRFPDRVILVGRVHDSKRKCSVRSKDVELPTKINAALQGLDGRGGGHTNACGVVVAEKDWDMFYERLSGLVEDEAKAHGKKEKA